MLLYMEAKLGKDECLMYSTYFHVNIISRSTKGHWTIERDCVARFVPLLFVERTRKSTYFMSYSYFSAYGLNFTEIIEFRAQSTRSQSL
jgi:hypothetical protein